MVKNHNFIFILSILLFAGLISCDDEKEQIAPKNPKGFTQIPRITVTQFDRWLGFSINDIEQLRSINFTNTSSDGTEHIKTPFKCSDDWTLYGRARTEDWPRQYASANIDFFLLHGHIQVISIKFNEKFSSILPQDSIWIDAKYRLGLLDERTYYGIKQASRKRKNALYPLEQMVESQCKVLTHNQKNIGYQCFNFALSASLRSTIHHGSLEHFTFQISNGSDVIKNGPTNPEVLFDTLNKPTPPMYIDDILFRDGGFSSRMLIYRNKDALHNFFEAVARDFKDVECISPI